MASMKDKLELLLDVVELTKNAETPGGLDQQLLTQLLPSEEIDQMIRFIDNDIMKTHTLLTMLKSHKSKQTKMDNTKATTSNVCDVGVQVEARPLSSCKSTFIADKIPKKVHFVKSQLETSKEEQTCRVGDSKKGDTNKEVFRSIATETERVEDMPPVDYCLDETIYLKLPDRIEHPEDILTGNMTHYVKTLGSSPLPQESVQIDLERAFKHCQSLEDVTFSMANESSAYRDLTAFNASTPKSRAQEPSLYESLDSVNASSISASPHIPHLDRHTFWESVIGKAGLSQDVVYD